MTNPVDENGNDILTPNKITQADANPNSYYRELRMLKVLSANQGEVVAAIDAMDPAQRGELSGADYYEQMQAIRDIIEKEEDSSEKSDSPKKPSDLLSRPILSALENYAPKTE